MLNTEDLQGLMQDGVVVDESGDKVGNIGQVYLDDESGNPEWVTSKTGLFGGTETFIPIRDASATGNEVRVPYSKAKIKDAPKMEDADGHLSPEQEQELYVYYGLANGHDGDVTSAHGDTDTRGQVGRGFGNHGPTATGSDDDASMVRSEEQVRIGKEKVATGKARLRKYVVTENVTTTVPVQREELRLEREPITDENRDAAMKDADFGEAEQEITLSEERVVVDKETVPVERVALDTETVTEEKQVTEEVRKEQIETDLPDEPNDQSTRR